MWTYVTEKDFTLAKNEITSSTSLTGEINSDKLVLLQTPGQDEMRTL